MLIEFESGRILSVDSILILDVLLDALDQLLRPRLGHKHVVNTNAGLPSILEFAVGSF
jgi:hypothetical protein